MSGRERFVTRWGLVLSAIGMAIGTGNIWRFPRVVTENGGGSFLVAWLVALFLWSIPLLMIEMVFGRRTRRGPIATFAELGGRQFTWLGAFVALTPIMILFYYSVVTGWCFRYFVVSIAYGSQLTSAAGEMWSLFSDDAVEKLVFHAAAIIAGCLILLQGVQRGIERTNRLMIPLLFVLLVVGAVRALTLPGAVEGLHFLFVPDLAKLASHKTWLEGLSQSAWSTGAGWSLLLVYANYMRRSERVTQSSLITGFGNNSASLLAGMMIVPAAFALLSSEQLSKAFSGNQGLAFVTVPTLMDKMPGGRIFVVVFFLALSMAALSSFIAIQELAVRVVMDFGAPRKRAVIVVGVMVFVFGAPSAVSMAFFDNQDFVWGVGLMVTGALFVLLLIKSGVKDFVKELHQSAAEPPAAKVLLWKFLAGLMLAEFAVMVGWWLYQASTAGDFMNPFKAFSLGTCLVQWIGALIVLRLLNGYINRKLSAGEES